MKSLALVTLMIVACQSPSPTPSVAPKIRGAALPSTPVVHTCAIVAPGNTCSDLLSAPIVAGEEGTTTVELPAGSTYVENSIVLTKDSIGKFQVESVTPSDHGSDSVELDVKFKNVGAATQPFTADFSYITVSQ